MLPSHNYATIYYCISLTVNYNHKVKFHHLMSLFTELYHQTFRENSSNAPERSHIVHVSTLKIKQVCTTLKSINLHKSEQHYYH